MSKLVHQVVDTCVKCPHVNYVDRYYCTRGFHKDLTDKEVYHKIPEWCKLPDAEEDYERNVRFGHNLGDCINHE